MAGRLFAGWNPTSRRGVMMLALAASGIGALSDGAPGQSPNRTVAASDPLGANARQAMIDIFRKKDATAVARYFGEAYIQHDPNLADGLAGMKAFPDDIASSPGADITIYR